MIGIATKKIRNNANLMRICVNIMAAEAGTGDYQTSTRQYWRESVLKVGEIVKLKSPTAGDATLVDVTISKINDVRDSDSGWSFRRLKKRKQLTYEVTAGEGIGKVSMDNIYRDQLISSKDQKLVSGKNPQQKEKIPHIMGQGDGVTLPYPVEHTVNRSNKKKLSQAERLHQKTLHPKVQQYLKESARMTLVLLVEAVHA